MGRYGVPRDWPTHPETEKRSPWVDLRQALDAEEDPNDFYNDVPIEDQGPNYDPHIVHDEGYFNRIQHASNHRNDKRGYNPLKVENLVGDPERVLKATPERCGRLGPRSHRKECHHGHHGRRG